MIEQCTFLLICHALDPLSHLAFPPLAELGHMSKPASFVFVHGGWHPASYWRPVMDALAGEGHRSYAVDLPGSGAHTAYPDSWINRTPTSFVTEHSPNAHITQDQRTQAVVELVEQAALDSGAAVVLVGHSLGGLTVTAVVERIPEKLSMVVYLSAFMLPPAMTALDWILGPSMTESMVASVLVNNPAAIGAHRIDYRSEDSEYAARVKATFAADVEESVWARHVKTLYCDEAAAVYVMPSPASAAGLGRLPRHYIRCTEDHAVPLTGQDYLIAAVDKALPGTTTVHTMKCGHEPVLNELPQLIHILINALTSSNTGQAPVHT